MFTRILVPVDYSAPSEAALAFARLTARMFDSHLHVLHVLDPIFLRAVVANLQDRRAAALKRLHDHLNDEDHQRFHAVTAIEESSVPADEIERYAKRHDIDLIVMGTHGHRGVAHALLGSVAERVVRVAPCPVITVREPQAPGDTGLQPPARILVPTDFSPPSDRALEHAQALARKSGASIHLLHVLEDLVDTASFGTEVFVPDSPEVRAARLQAARERLAARTAVGAGDPRVTTEVVVGAGARTIVRYAAEQHFDLIVMGTHGRTGLAHLLMGSVAEGVVRTANCPVFSTHDASTAVQGASPPAGGPGTGAQTTA
jgi:nucleotide-binding universal stress UspA family protein